MTLTPAPCQRVTRRTSQRLEGFAPRSRPFCPQAHTHEALWGPISSVGLRLRHRWELGTPSSAPGAGRGPRPTAGPTRAGGETSLLGVRLNSRCFSWRALEVHGALPSPAEKEKTREPAPHHCRGRWEAAWGCRRPPPGAGGGQRSPRLRAPQRTDPGDAGPGLPSSRRPRAAAHVRLSSLSEDSQRADARRALS